MLIRLDVTTWKFHEFWILSLEIRNNFVYLSIAKQIRDDLKIRITQSNIPRLFQLKSEVTDLKQDNPIVTQYLTKYRTLMDELDVLITILKQVQVFFFSLQIWVLVFVWWLNKCRCNGD